MGLHKIIKILAVALSIVGAIFLIMIISKGDDAIEAIYSEGGQSAVDYMSYIAYAVLAIILVIVLIFVLKGLFAGNIKKTLISVGLFFGIVIVSYLMSSGTDLDLQPFINKGQDITEATSRNVGAGLYTFYALAVFAIGSMAFSGIKKMIK